MYLRLQLWQVVQPNLKLMEKEKCERSEHSYVCKTPPFGGFFRRTPPGTRLRSLFLGASPWRAGEPIDRPLSFFRSILAEGVFPVTVFILPD